MTDHDQVPPAEGVGGPASLLVAVLSVTGPVVVPWNVFSWPADDHMLTMTIVDSALGECPPPGYGLRIQLTPKDQPGETK